MKNGRRALFLTLVILLLAAVAVPAFAASDTSTVTFTAIEKIGLTVNDYDFSTYGDGVVYTGIKNNALWFGTSEDYLFQIVDNYNDQTDQYPVIPTATVMVKVDASALSDWTYNNTQANPVLPDDQLNLVYRLPSGYMTPTQYDHATLDPVSLPDDTVLQTTDTTLFTDAVPGYYGGELGVNLGHATPGNAQVNTPISLTLTWTARVN